MKIKSIMVLASMAFAMMGSWSAVAGELGYPWNQAGTIVCTNKGDQIDAKIYACDVTAWGRDQGSTNVTVFYRKCVEGEDWKTLCSHMGGGLNATKAFNLTTLLPEGIGDYALKMVTQNETNLTAKVRIEPSVYKDRLPYNSSDSVSVDAILLPWEDTAMVSVELGNVNTNSLSESHDRYHIYFEAYGWSNKNGDKGSLSVNLGSLTKNDIVEHTDGVIDSYVKIVKALDLSKVRDELLPHCITNARYCTLKVQLRILLRNTDGTEVCNRTKAPFDFHCDFRYQFTTLKAFYTKFDDEVHDAFVVNFSPNYWGKTESTTAELSLSNLTHPNEPRTATVDQRYDEYALYNLAPDYFNNQENMNCWHRLTMTDGKDEVYTFDFSIGDDVPPLDPPHHDVRDIVGEPLIVSCDYGVSVDGTAQGPYWNIGVEIEVNPYKLLNGETFAQWVEAAVDADALRVIRTSNLADFADPKHQWTYEGRMTPGILIGAKDTKTYDSGNAGVVYYSLPTNSAPFVKAAVITVEPVK